MDFARSSTPSARWANVASDVQFLERFFEQRTRAQTDGRSLEEIATAVVSGKIKFD